MRVGIIGCGRIAQVHLAALRTLPWVEVVGVCDVEARSAQTTAQRFGVTGVYTSVDELLLQGEPQAVHVLTPPHTHGALVRRALEAEMHVFVEKPMATNAAEAETLCALARQQRVSLCVDHNRLFDPVVKKALAVVQAGGIGDVVSVETYQGFQRQALLAGTSNGVQHSAAEAFYNLAIHPVYLQLAFLGSVQRVEVMSRKTGRLSGSFAEECRVLLEGEKALGYLCFSVDIQPYLNALHIYGTTGTLFLNLNTMTLVSHTASRLPKLLQKGAYNVVEALQLLTAAAQNAVLMATRRLTLYPGIAEVIRRFYVSLEQGTPPPVRAEEGCEAVRVMERIYLSAAQDATRVPAFQGAATLTSAAQPRLHR